MKKLNEIALPENYAAILGDVAREVQISMGDVFRNIILFGSYSRGDYNSDSDIDLLILISDENTNKYKPLVAEISGRILAEYCIVISMIVVSESFFEDCAGVMDLLINVKNEGVAII